MKKWGLSYLPLGNLGIEADKGAGQTLMNAHLVGRKFEVADQLP